MDLDSQISRQNAIMVPANYLLYDETHTDRRTQSMTEQNPGLFAGADGTERCWWCQGHADYRKYHDDEWGHPTVDDHRLFEKVCLEGFQSGLSWLTILRKRDAFRVAFENFDFHKVATFNDRRVAKLLQNKGIIRHQGKILATIHNAARAIEMETEFGSLAAWFWQHEPPQSREPLQSKADALFRTTCHEAEQMSQALKKRGWKFVGPTTSYAFMQAMGMVNDHLQGCFKYAAIEELRKKLQRPQ